MTGDLVSYAVTACTYTLRKLRIKSGAEVVVPPDPRHVTALGAALMAIQRLGKQKSAP